MSEETPFEDVAETAGVAVRYQLPPGVLVTPYLAGGAVGDFNNNGWQDLFVLGGGANPDRLFINNGDGTFTDRAEEWGVDALHVGSGVAVGDFDGDGWLDIYVTSLGPDGETPGSHKLYRNNGDGTFTDVAAAAGVQFTSVTRVDGYSAAFGDYNLNGRLDLFVAGWLAPAQGNRLFRNNGDGTFTDVTSEALPNTIRTARGFAPRFVDMNGDRYPELLLAADFGESRYYVNNRDDTFSDDTQAAGVGLDSNGMGHAVGDFDGDGLPDWYVTSIHNTAQPAQFGNALYRNLGGDRYEEIGAQAGVHQGGWGWGAVAVDLDLDGRLDLAATNGWTTIQWLNVPTRVFRNLGSMQFEEVGESWGIVDAGQGRGLLHADFDNNGAQDLIVFSLDLPVHLYRNRAGAEQGWLRVFLDTQARPDLAPNGIGAKVYVRTAAGEQVRHIDGGSNYLSQSELSAHFGLGAAQSAEELRIVWPDGHTSIYPDLPANRTLRIAADPRGDLDGDGIVGLADLSILLSNLNAEGPVNRDDGDLTGDGAVGLDDLAALLLDYGLESPRILE